MFLVNSFKKAWRGEENLWIVLFTWYSLGNIIWISLFIKFFNYGKEINLAKDILIPVSGIIVIGFFLYLHLSTLLLWRCAGNSCKNNSQNRRYVKIVMRYLGLSTLVMIYAAILLFIWGITCEFQNC